MRSMKRSGGNFRKSTMPFIETSLPPENTSVPVGLKRSRSLMPSSVHSAIRCSSLDRMAW